MPAEMPANPPRDLLPRELPALPRRKRPAPLPRPPALAREPAPVNPPKEEDPRVPAPRPPRPAEPPPRPRALPRRVAARRPPLRERSLLMRRPPPPLPVMKKRRTKAPEVLTKVKSPILLPAETKNPRRRLKSERPRLWLKSASKPSSAEREEEDPTPRLRKKTEKPPETSPEADPLPRREEKRRLISLSLSPRPREWAPCKPPLKLLKKEK